MNNWFVYILRCSDDSLYTGVTTDLVRRLAEHNGARPPAARYTRGRLPVTLVYREAVGTRSAAARREAAIKKMGRARKLALCSANGE